MGKVDLVNRAWTGVIAFAIVALGAAAVYFVYAAKQNRDAADRWQDKAGTLERTLTARTRQLNTRTEALNKAASALKRSEQDVDELENRQRQLANEKAQVEDARGALELQATSLATIAGEQRQCTSQLTELLNRYAAEDFEWVDANADAVGQSCQQAQDDFAALEAASGGGQ